MAGSLNERTAVITGASSGIGKATASIFAREGTRVVLVDRDASGEAVAASIRQGGGHAIFAQADVGNAEEIDHFVERAVSSFGAIDILVNNAGIQRRHERLDQWTVDDVRKVIDVDLIGLFLTAKAAVPAMPKHGGAIVNISSTAALVPVAYSPPYAAAKAGVMALTRSLAALLAERGVRVNALLPGMVDTPFLSGRDPAVVAGQSARYAHGLLQPADVGLAIAYLARQPAMTGKLISVQQTASGPRLMLVEDPPRLSEWTDQPFASG